MPQATYRQEIPHYMTSFYLEFQPSSSNQNQLEQATYSLAVTHSMFLNPCE